MVNPHCDTSAKLGEETGSRLTDFQEFSPVKCKRLIKKTLYFVYPPAAVLFVIQNKASYFFDVSLRCDAQPRKVRK